ncbi:hypothetical protein AAMO2058_000594200 [Amorphochlora amoebiformis]
MPRTLRERKKSKLAGGNETPKRPKKKARADTPIRCSPRLRAKRMAALQEGISSPESRKKRVINPPSFSLDTIIEGEVEEDKTKEQQREESNQINQEKKAIEGEEGQEEAIEGEEGQEEAIEGKKGQEEHESDSDDAPEEVSTSAALALDEKRREDVVNAERQMREKSKSRRRNLVAGRQRTSDLLNISDLKTAKLTVEEEKAIEKQKKLAAKKRKKLEKIARAKAKAEAKAARARRTVFESGETEKEGFKLKVVDRDDPASIEKGFKIPQRALDIMQRHFYGKRLNRGRPRISGEGGGKTVTRKFVSNQKSKPSNRPDPGNKKRKRNLEDLDQ